MQDLSDLEEFIENYIICALGFTPDNSNRGDYLDEFYGPGDIAATAMETIRKDCKAFYEANKDIYMGSYQHSPRGDQANAAADFWLGRNQVGGRYSSFMDNVVVKETAEKLATAAVAFGQQQLYVEECGRISVSHLGNPKYNDDRKNREESDS